MGDIDKIAHMDNVKLSDNERAVIILDQTALPNREEYITLKTAKDIYDAIFELKVRGAPAIGICAGYGMYILAQQIETDERELFLQKLHDFRVYLDASRPTAVNLSWALNRMERVARAESEQSVREIVETLGCECRKIYDEDVSMCAAISEYGLSLINDNDGILTHCNAGALATSRYGTALGPIFLGHERGMNFRVFADETRPLLQGARLTSYELSKSGIDVTLICDNMASIVMKNGWIDACFVGCDRIARNGDVANKIGTSAVAILSKHYGIPFYVLGPTSTVDLNCKNGDDIKIELRDPEEIKSKFYIEPMALPEVKCYNPAFDVTDHTMITAIITEKGICHAPFEKSIPALFGE